MIINVLYTSGAHNTNYFANIRDLNFLRHYGQYSRPEYWPIYLIP